MLIIKVYRKKNYVVTIQPDIWPDIRYPAKKIGRISGNSVSGATLVKNIINLHIQRKISSYTHRIHRPG